MKNAKLFTYLKAEAGNYSAQCLQKVEQLQSRNAVIENEYPCVSEALLKKAIRDAMELKGFMPHSSCIKELNALQSHYHKMMNNRDREIGCYFQCDDFGNDSEFYL